MGFSSVTCGGVARQGRFVLRGLAGEEAVEVLEAIAGRPIVERPLGGDLIFRRVVPLAPGAGVVAVVLQHFGDRRRRLRDDPAESVEVVGDRRDLAVADKGVIAPGQQRSPRGRAHGGGVETVEGDAHLRHAIERRRVDLAAVGRGRARPHVVHQDDQDVRSALGEVLRLDALLVGGILHRQPRSGGGRRGREGQDFLRRYRRANTMPTRRVREDNCLAAIISMSNSIDPFALFIASTARCCCPQMCTISTQCLLCGKCRLSATAP